MSAYTTREAILTEIPAAILDAACDDDGDRTADEGLLDSIIAAASAEVDALLPGADAYIASQSALIFACEKIFRRRLVETNPYSTMAEAKRKELILLSGGEQVFGNVPTTLERDRYFTRADQDGF
jgi:hypothetical protein